MLDPPPFDLADYQARQTLRVRQILAGLPPGARTLLRRLDAAGSYFHRLYLRTGGTFGTKLRYGAASEAARRASVAITELKQACWELARTDGGRHALLDERTEDEGFVGGDGI